RGRRPPAKGQGNKPCRRSLRVCSTRGKKRTDGLRKKRPPHAQDYSRTESDTGIGVQHGKVYVLGEDQRRTENGESIPKLYQYGQAQSGRDYTKLLST